MASRVPGVACVLLPVLVLVLVLAVSGVSVDPSPAEDSPACQSTLSHATCPAEFDQLIQRFSMVSTPAGTYFAPMFTSDQVSADGQPVTNTILELQPAGTRIPWLRTNVTTQLFLWHHRGAALAVHALLADGTYSRQVLGDPLRHEHAHYQLAMPYMTWVSTEVLSQTEYVLLSGSAVPAFNRFDYELAAPADLLASYPQHKAVILAAYGGAAATNTLE